MEDGDGPWLDRIIEDDAAEMFLRDQFKESRFRWGPALMRLAWREGIEFSPTRGPGAPLKRAMRVLGINARKRPSRVWGWAYLWKRGKWHDGMDREDEPVKRPQ